MSLRWPLRLYNTNPTHNVGLRPLRSRLEKIVYVCVCVRGWSGLLSGWGLWGFFGFPIVGAWWPWPGLAGGLGLGLGLALCRRAGGFAAPSRGLLGRVLRFGGDGGRPRHASWHSATHRARTQRRVGACAFRVPLWGLGPAHNPGSSGSTRLRYGRFCFGSSVLVPAWLRP